MFVGKVIGTVWATVKWPAVQGQKLLLVRPYHLSDLWAASRAASLQSQPPVDASALPEGMPLPLVPNSEAVVCVDLLDAGVGDSVVVAFGHAARVAAESLTGNADPGHEQALRPGFSAVPQTLQPTIPIDAAVVAIVDGLQVMLPGT
jgi:microcompartment protein CcmK/EutM